MGMQVQLLGDFGDSVVASRAGTQPGIESLLLFVERVKKRFF
jgi:hypothetical protein